MSAPVVKVNGLSWEAGGKSILSDLNFDISVGEFVGLIGPNGAGKSSLMRCMYRVNKPSSGKISILGDDVWKISAKDAAKRTAVIVQELAEIIDLRVWDVIAQGLTPHKGLFDGDTREDKLRQQNLVENLDLGRLVYEQFASLSGGEKQRVLLARALMQNPRLLIMDEPTNHLDVHYQIDILQQVKTLGLTVLASFHDLNLAAAYCDKIIVLDEGKLVTQGEVEEVLTQELVESVFRAHCVVDKHPLYKHPRVTYAYHERN